MSRDRRPKPHGSEQARIGMNTGMFTYNPNRGCTLSIEDALSTFPSTVDTIRAGDVDESIIKNRVLETRRIAGNSSEPRRQSSVRVKSIMEPGTSDPASVHHAQHPKPGSDTIGRIQSGKKTGKYDCHDRRQSRGGSAYIDVQRDAK